MDSHNVTAVIEQGASVDRVARSEHKAITLRHFYEVECVRWYHEGDVHCIDHNCAGRAKDIGTCLPRVVWTDTIDNLVVTTGMNQYLSQTLRGVSTGGPSGGYNDGRKSPVPWASATAYSVGDVVVPTPASKTVTPSNRKFIAIVAGTSGAAPANEPTWPTVNGGTVVDATVTWLEMSNWYVGIITGPGSGNTYAAADTMASHAGWPENTAAYSGARQAYVPSAPAAGEIDNGASKASFAIIATATIAGAFVADFPGTPGSRSNGTLFGEGNFTGGDKAVASGDTLNVTVTISLS